MSFTSRSLEPTSVSSMRVPHPPRRTHWEDDSDVAPTPEMRTQFAEHHDRMRPAIAGFLAGAAAGACMLATANKILQGRHDAHDLVASLGRLASHGTLSGIHGYAAGFGAAAVAGAAVGVLFATITRHLRKFVPLVIWSLVFFPAAWTLLQAFVFPRTAPWLGAMLPYVPMLAGTAVYAVVVSLQLPIRAKKPPFEL